MTTPLHAEPVWRTVPVEPTEAMVEAAQRATPTTYLFDGEPQNIWSAMLAAAPAQGGGQLSGNTGELAEAVEVVTEWLAMAEAVPTQTYGVLRYPPISQGEMDAIALLAKGDSHE